MITYVKGFIPDNDPTYLKHRKVLIACLEADINELPKETAKYFGSKYPDKCLLEEKLEVEIKAEEWRDNISSRGYEVYIKDLPQGVEKIRFCNSW